MRPVALVFAPLLLAYGATMVWLWDSWMLRDSYYSHGPLMPLLIGVLLWLQRAELSVLASGADGRGWWLLAPGLLTHLAGAALMIDSLSAVSLLMTVPGAVWLAFGTARLRKMAPVLMLVVFAVPMPIFMTGRVAFELKEFAIGAAVWLSGVVGVEVQRVGADLLVPPHSEMLQVADPCSGLRSLIALTTLGYCIAFFLGSQRGMRRWVLLLSAVPIAIASNVVRITAVCWLAREEGVTFAATTGHDILNYAVWGVDFAMLLVVDRLLSVRRAGASS